MCMWAAGYFPPTRAKLSIRRAGGGKEVREREKIERQEGVCGRKRGVKSSGEENQTGNEVSAFVVSCMLLSKFFEMCVNIDSWN